LGFDAHGDLGGTGEPEGETMPLYLSRFSYTPETQARLIGNPEEPPRGRSVPPRVVGGKLHGFWYAFAHDGFTLWEAPDNVSMAAVALKISGGRALSSQETTVLLTVNETMDACAWPVESSTEHPACSGSSADLCRWAGAVDARVREVQLPRSPAVEGYPVGPGPAPTLVDSSGRCGQAA
jgi:hypothetical protein